MILTQTVLAQTAQYSRGKSAARRRIDRLALPILVAPIDRRRGLLRFAAAARNGREFGSIRRDGGAEHLK
jgi:hypothetical protein